MKPAKSISAVTILLSLFITGGMPRANAQEQHSLSDPMTESLAPLTGKEFEAGFLNQMIQHHQGAIEMAEMVSSHTKRPELIAYAKIIISAQGKEIDEMTRWLKEWEGAEPEQMPNMVADRKMTAEMPMLETPENEEFDRMFLEMMIDHHSAAVRMSGLVKERSTRPELLKLAERVIKDQAAEIQQMENWKKMWFRK